ncbi:MAG TPA: Grx4 family monothiol glutaredoxin [Polyangiaceae bacterium]|jgi:monothiol glutaredoxin|nr:Grx4 family monothiol glutaredoxin [Polyangiaceae bacterium]
MPLTEAQRADFSRLVNAHPVVLFMKGNPRAPACGFSATVVGILDKLLPRFHTVDILQAPHVREGMKEYSNWPTFPQLYVGGEFVGGCDIVKELHASGELQTVLAGVAEAASAGVSEGVSSGAGAGEGPPPDGAPVEAPAIAATPGAVRALREALAGAEPEVLRLEIDGSFTPDLHLGPKQPGDIAVDLGAADVGAVVLHVDRTSVGRAKGLRIDFVPSPEGMAFKIDNPNAPPKVKRAQAQEVKAMLDAGTARLFDVRPEAERTLASIPQAVALDGEGLVALEALPRDAAIVLHCHHGMRSYAAAQQLIAGGFTNVYNLEGGIEAWSRDVDPSVPRY